MNYKMVWDDPAFITEAELDITNYSTGHCNSMQAGRCPSCFLRIGGTPHFSQAICGKA